MAAAMRAARDKEGDDEGGESDGDAYKESLLHLSHAIACNIAFVAYIT
jgi:hypothetical protein